MGLFWVVYGTIPVKGGDYVQLNKLFQQELLRLEKIEQARFNSQMLELKRQEIELIKEKLEQDKQIYDLTTIRAYRAANEKRTSDYKNKLHLTAQHDEHISLLKRVQNAEWIRWLITSSIAVVALVIAVLAFIQG